MKIGPFTIERTKALPVLQPLSGRGGWWSIIRESYMGAWQRNVEVTAENVLTYSAVFACVTLISSDIGKLGLRLVQRDDDGIWTETESPAFSPFLRKPNRYQNRIKFIEQWITSKLIHGNAYILKQRDRRGIVVGGYGLDPSRVTPLVANDGSVYYELRRDDLSGVKPDTITVPASEIIHDTMVCLYHPLVGVSPIYACGIAALQGLSIQSNSHKFFSVGSNPGGVLTAPGAIGDETAQRLKKYWDENFTGDNVGKVAVLGDGLKYEQMSVNAVDAQLIEQLKWTGETVCSCFHVPPYMVGIGPPPPYANVEPLLQQYYSQCLQSLITSLELCLDEGLGLSEKIDGTQYGVELDIKDLIWMDTATKMTAAQNGIRSGMTVDEIRRLYHGLPSVKGGDVVYMQEQNHSLEALAALDKAKIEAAKNPQPVPQALPPKPDDEEEDDEQMDMAASFGMSLRKHWEADRAAA